MTAFAMGNTRVNLSILHLLAAARFSRSVGVIERRHTGEPLGPFWDDILSESLGCILTASAGIEAYANELFRDSATTLPGIAPDEIADRWADFKWASPLEKYDVILKWRNKPAMNAGAAPYQAMKAFVGLRNGLTHFKPESSDDLIEHARISKTLEQSAVRSPFFTPHDPLFSLAWASHGTTARIVKSTRLFVSSFSHLAGLENRLTQFEDRLTP